MCNAGDVSKPHVVIVGGGFAGLNAADELASMGCRVTIVDRRPYTTFQPLLYQVATGGLNPGDVTYSLRSYAGRRRAKVRFRRAGVTGIDSEARVVHCDRGEPIEYDFLVLAQGAGISHFGIPGAEENTYSIYTRGQALEVRDEVMTLLDHLAVDPYREAVIVVVGGGATGVEMAGTLAEMRMQGIPIAYPDVHPSRIRVMLVEMGDAVLAPFEPDLRDYTFEQLVQRGVDVRLQTAIAEVGPDTVRFKDGETMQADLVVWAAGIGAHPIVEEWGMPQGRGGRIEVSEHLLVHGHDRIFAVGDGAIIDDNALPQQAQPAIQQGRHVAQQIKALCTGEPLRPFAYVDKGTMATIGRSAAVVQLKNGPKFTGFPAWSIWVALHLSFLLGGRNRIQAMINLGFRYLLYPRTANSIVGDVREEPTKADE